MKKRPDTFEELRELCRQEWRYASPYRMGVMAVEVGYCGDHDYANKPRALRLYKEGIARGEKEKRCNHPGYDFEKHGRCCHECGAFVTDFGD